MINTSCSKYALYTTAVIKKHYINLRLMYGNIYFLKHNRIYIPIAFLNMENKNVFDITLMPKYKIIN